MEESTRSRAGDNQNNSSPFRVSQSTREGTCEDSQAWTDIAEKYILLRSTGCRTFQRTLRTVSWPQFLHLVLSTPSLANPKLLSAAERVGN